MGMLGAMAQQEQGRQCHGREEPADEVHRVVAEERPAADVPHPRGWGGHYLTRGMQAFGTRDGIFFLRDVIFKKTLFEKLQY